MLIINISLNAQKALTVDALIGFGVNGDLAIANHDIYKYSSLTVQANVNYHFPVYENFFGETGLGGEWYSNFGEAEVLEFTSQSLRANIHAAIGHPISPKISICIGAVISNNKDFKTFARQTMHNIRSSLLIKGVYRISNTLDGILLLKHNLSNISDQYLIDQPKFEMNMGVAYKFYER